MGKSPSGSDVTVADRVVAAVMSAASRRPWIVIAVVLALVLGAGSAATRLGVDADSSKMIAAHLPSQQRAQALNAAFPYLKSSVAIVVQSGNADAADMAVMKIVEQLNEVPDWIASVFAPSVDPFLVAHGFMYRTTEEVDENFTRLSKSANLLARLRTDPSIETFFAALNEAAILTERAEISADALDRLYAETAAVLEARSAGKSRGFAWTSVLEGDDGLERVTRVITVVPVLDRTRLSPAKPALEVIDTIIEDLPEDLARPVKIGVTGEPALRAEEMASVLGTIALSLALSLVFVALILAVGLRSIRRSLLALASLIVSLVVTTGFAALTVGQLNLVSVAFVVLLVGLGIDFAIHVLAHICEQRRHGSPLETAITLTGQRTGLALGLSAVTTALAFLAFAFTDFAGMSQLGLIGAAGVLIAFVTAITLIPAGLAIGPGTAGEPGDQAPPLPQLGFRPAIPMIIVAAGIAAILPASQVRFDADPMGLRDPDAPSVRTFQALALEPETTPYRASIVTDTAANARDIARKVEESDYVGAAISISDLVPDEQERKLDLLDLAALSIDHAVAGQPTDLIDEPENEADALNSLFDRLAPGSPGSERLKTALNAYRVNRTPETDASLETDLFRYFDLLIDRLNGMLDADMVTAQDLPRQMYDRFVSPTGEHRVEVVPQEDLGFASALDRFVNAVTEISPDASGGPVQLKAAADTVSRSILQAVLIAAIATGLLGWLATRRIGDTAAIMVPLAFAAVITAGTSVLLDMPFNYANVIVLPLLIGIGIDSGIHIAVRERRAPGAVFTTSTPRAVLVSALTTMAAFDTLALSDHRGTASMGILLAVAMSAAILCVLGLTPAIMRMMKRV